MRRNNEEVMEELIKIKYNYVPKYCKTWMIQGHNEEQCFVVNPEFYPKKKRQGKKKENDRTEKILLNKRGRLNKSGKHATIR